MGWCLLELLANCFICLILCPQDVHQNLDAALAGATLRYKSVYQVKKQKLQWEYSLLHLTRVRNQHIKLTRCTRKQLLYSCSCRIAFAVWLPIVSLLQKCIKDLILATLGLFNFMHLGFTTDYTEGVFVLMAMQRKDASLWICTYILELDFFIIIFQGDNSIRKHFQMRSS